MSGATETTPIVHLDIAMTEEQREKIECAATIIGLTIEEFVVSTLEVNAENVIRGPQEPHKPLSPRAYVQLMEALLNPPEPSEELRARYQRYLRRLGE